MIGQVFLRFLELFFLGVAFLDLLLEVLLAIFDPVCRRRFLFFDDQGLALRLCRVVSLHVQGPVLGSNLTTEADHSTDLICLLLVRLAPVHGFHIRCIARFGSGQIDLVDGHNGRKHSQSSITLLLKVILLYVLNLKLFQVKVSLNLEVFKLSLTQCTEHVVRDVCLLLVGICHGHIELVIKLESRVSLISLLQL